MLAILGMSLYWPLLRRGQINLIFSGTEATAFEMQWYYLGSVVLIIFLTILVLVFRHRLSEILPDRRRPLAVLLTCVASTAVNVSLILFPAVSGSMVLFLPKSFFFALSFLVLTYAWGAFFIRHFSRSFLLALAVSFLLSTLVTLLDLTPQPLCYVLPVLSPLLSGSAWFYCMKKSIIKEKPFEASAGSLPLRFIFLLVAFLLLGGVIRGFIYLGNAMFTPSLDSLSIAGISTVFSLFIIGMIVISKQGERIFNTVWVIFAVIYFAGLFLLVLSNTVERQLGNDVIIATRTCFNFFLFAALVSGAYHARVSPVAALSIFVLTEACSSLLSYLIVPAIVAGLGVSFEEHLSVFALAMALALIVCSFFFLTDKSISPAPHRMAEDLENSITKDAVARLALRFDLTEREQEVCELLSQGHNYKKIASMLYIAPNTVLAHTRKVYQKMDIHSKQDLIDLVCREKVI